MIPSHLVDQPLEVLARHGYKFSDMSVEQKETAKWWDEHYNNAYQLPLQASAEFRYEQQGYHKVTMTFVTGKYSVWGK